MDHVARAFPSLTRIDLAREADFTLGPLKVRPSRREVEAQGVRHVLQRRVMQVLVALAHPTAEVVSHEELIRRCWGGLSVGEDAVGRCIGQLRRFAAQWAEPPFAIETIAGVGYRLDVPAGRALEAVGGSPAPPTPFWRRRHVRPALAVATLVAVVLVATWFGLARWSGDAAEPARSPPPPGQNGHVDVMAFEAASADPALRKIAADTPEAVVRALADLGIAVAARRELRDAAPSAAELRVTGAVQRDGANYVVNAQVLDRRTGLILWADRFTRTPREQQAAPDDTARNIAGVLHCAIQDRNTARAPLSTEAFGLLLNVCANWAGGFGGAERMLALTRQLVKAAPRFANAHALRSIAAAHAAGEAEHSPAEAAALHAESKAAAEQALKLDPQTPKAYSGLAGNEGIRSKRLNQNRILEEQYVLKGLSLDPENPPLRNDYAALLRSTGRINEAIDFIRASSVPHGVEPDGLFAMLLAANGDPAGGEAALNRIEATSRASTGDLRAAINFWWDDPKLAVTRVRALTSADAPKDRTDCAVTYLRELEVRKAKGVRGLPQTCRSVDANWRVRMLAREGDVDGAFAELKSPISGGTLLLYYPEMKAVRRDPRFWPFAKSVGLTDYWLKSGHWPDFCAEPDLPYDCKVEAAKLSAVKPRA